MASDDFHKHAFKKHTLLKLEMFEAYTRAWIPVFPASSNVPVQLQIFDLFAGPGYDIVGIPGSAIRILKAIALYRTLLVKRETLIELHFNDSNASKLEQLRVHVEAYIRDTPELSEIVSVHWYCEDTEVLLPRLSLTFNRNPSLVFLDQTGVKHLSKEDIARMTATKRTDYLMFFASAHVRRLGATSEFAQYLDVLNVEAIRKVPYHQTTREITIQLNKSIPSSSSLRFYPFSMMNGRNIYGLIFAASHLLAVDKFLKIAWETNSENGDANYDIDDESVRRTNLSLFDGVHKPMKREHFESQVVDEILQGRINNNIDLYEFALRNGFQGEFAGKIVEEMKRNGEIAFPGRKAHVNYAAYKNKKRILFQKGSS